MRLGELILLEAKDEYVVKAFGPKIVDQWYNQTGKKKPKNITDEKVNELALKFVRDTLIPLDPTSNQKYLVWIAKLYADGKLKEEDFYKVPETLAVFNRVQPKLAQKDIMQYKSLQDLFRALEPFEDEEAQKSGKEKRREERTAAIAGADLVYDTADFRMYRINTQQAACELGKGTKWCTAATKSQNYFKDYASGGTLYAVIPTKPVKDGPFQLYFPNPFDAGYEDFQAADKFDDALGIEDLLGVLPSLKAPILELFKAHKSPITPNFAEIYGKDVMKSLPIESRIPIVLDAFEDFFEYRRMSAAEVNKILQGSFTPGELKTILAHPRVTVYLTDAFIEESPMAYFRKAAKVFGGMENVQKIVRKLPDKYYREIFENMVAYGNELPSKTTIDKILKLLGKSRKQALKYLMNHKPSNGAIFKWMIHNNGTAVQAFVAELTQKDRLSVIEAVSDHSLPHLLRIVDKANSFKNLTSKELEKLAKITENAYKIRKAKLPKDAYLITQLPTLKELNDLHIKLIGEKINTNIKLPKLTTQQKAEGRLIHMLGDIDFNYAGIEWYEVNGNSLVKALGRGLPASKNIMEATLSTGFITPREKGYMLLVVARGVLDKAWLAVIPYGKEDDRTVLANTEQTRLYSYDKITLNDSNLKSSLDQLIDYVRADDYTDVEIDTTEFQESKK